MALALCNETSIWLIDKRPAIPEAGVIADTWTSTVNLTGAKIVGNPLVIDSDFINGNIVVVPTDKGMVTFNIKRTVSGVLVHYVSNVVLDGVKWQKNYSYTKNNQTVDFDPVISEHMITFPDQPNQVNPFNTRMIIVATNTNKLVSYSRDNGSIVWVTDISMPKLRDFFVQDLYPTPKGVIVTGRTGLRGFIAEINPATGAVAVNYTQYTTFEGTPDTQPTFVLNTEVYIFSTDTGIYLFNGALQLNATFSAPQGGAVTPVSYVGNIYIAGINTGNYWAVVTKENTLFVETLYGVNIAPLPPGTYSSGNRYILGTDYEGHDILTWLMFGTRAELMVGVTAAFFAVVVGTIVGLVAGFYTGLIDDILMRATDVVLALPGLVIILLFAAVFGPSLLNIIIIIAILSWAGIARVIRSVTLSLKERAFVDAARVAGASESRIIFVHIAPNVLGYTFLYMTFNISGAIVTEAILAFLGFGDVNSVTWGMMLQFLQISGHTLNAPWWLLPPGLAISLLSLSFYLIGRAFDEVVNPRLRRR
jgi:peptide/nickel transport system permease protein